MTLRGIVTFFRRRPIGLFIQMNDGPTWDFASRVPGTGGSLCVHPALGPDRGVALTHVRSGRLLCLASSEAAAFGFGERLWAGLSDHGRSLVIRAREPAALDALLPLDRRWMGAVLAGAKSSLSEESSSCPT